MMKRCIAAAMAALMVMTAFPAMALAETEEEKSLTTVTLNEVAHSIFYAPQYVAIEEGYFEKEGIFLELVTGFGAIYKVQNKFYLKFFQKTAFILKQGGMNRPHYKL